jgi:hypothetical protein
MHKITKPFSRAAAVLSLMNPDWMLNNDFDSLFDEPGIDSMLQEALLDVNAYTLHEFFKEALSF